MRCRCSASQESLETMSSRALRRSAGGTLSSRSRMSASAFAFAAFSIIEGLLPGTNIIDLMGFTWNSVTRARRQQCHRKLEHACSFRLEPRLLDELAERRQLASRRQRPAKLNWCGALNSPGICRRCLVSILGSRGEDWVPIRRVKRPRYVQAAEHQSAARRRPSASPGVLLTGAVMTKAL